MGTQAENALFETKVLGFLSGKTRNRLQGGNVLTNWPFENLYATCTDNCYAIPYYHDNIPVPPPSSHLYRMLLDSLYWSNKQWIGNLTNRALSLGDCGYKQGVSGQYSAPETEMITAIFQKLKQNGDVKKNVSVEQIIWNGKGYIQGNLEPYETTLPYTTTVYSCSNYNGVCITTEEKCTAEGGTVQAAANEGETICPENMVCCVNTQLGT